jgi:hypothetical protein
MSWALSGRDFDRYDNMQNGGSARAELEEIRAQSREMVARVTDAALVGGTAFAFGWYQGRNGGMPELFGLPYDLLAAIVLHGINFAGYGGQYEEYIHSVANGALASYAVNAGARLGVRMAQEAAGATPAPAAGGAATAGWNYQNGRMYQAAA